MARIKFLNLVVSPVYGNCAPGGLVVCDDAFARHCVEELHCAEYVQPVAVPPPADLEPDPEPDPVPRKRKKA